MQTRPAETTAPDAVVEGLARTRYKLVVSVVHGHEQTHTPCHHACRPQCGGSACQAFALFRDQREEQR
jgi:hypothetical protein